MRRVLFITICRAKEGSGKRQKDRVVCQMFVAYRVQMSLQEIAANNSSHELQNSSYNLVIIYLSDII